MSFLLKFCQRNWNICKTKFFFPNYAAYAQISITRLKNLITKLHGGEFNRASLKTNPDACKISIYNYASVLLVMPPMSASYERSVSYMKRKKKLLHPGNAESSTYSKCKLHRQGVVCKMRALFAPTLQNLQPATSVDPDQTRSKTRCLICTICYSSVSLYIQKKKYIDLQYQTLPLVQPAYNVYSLLDLHEKAIKLIEMHKGKYRSLRIRDC